MPGGTPGATGKQYFLRKFWKVSRDLGLEKDDIPDEIDFSRGKRSLHYIDPDAAHTVYITKNDGTLEIHYYKPLPGAITLDPDLQRIFPDSDSVNKALRSITTKD